MKEGISATNRIWAIIPARKGSKRVPNKNIADLNGKPLLAYSVQTANQSTFISKTIVTTDCPNIADIAKNYGAEIPSLRPKEISGDKSTDYEFLIHVLDCYKMKKEPICNIIVLLRPVTPLRNTKIVDRAIKTFINSPGASSLCSIQEMSDTAYKKVEIDNNVLVTVFEKDRSIDKIQKTAQSFNKTFTMNGYVDILRTKNIEK